MELMQLPPILLALAEQRSLDERCQNGATDPSEPPV
jgi:hypothetical protein